MLMLIKLNFCSCSFLVAATCVCSSTPWSIPSLSVFLDVRITKIPRRNVHQDAVRCGLVDRPFTLSSEPREDLALCRQRKFLHFSVVLAPHGA